MGMMEILVIVVVAILVLGPDKLPAAIVDIAKVIKALKKNIDDAKESIDKELKLSELREENAKYRAEFDKLDKGIRQKLSLEEFDDIKEKVKDSLEGTKKSEKDLSTEKESKDEDAFENKDEVTKETSQEAVKEKSEKQEGESKKQEAKEEALKESKEEIKEEGFVVQKPLSEPTQYRDACFEDEDDDEEFVSEFVQLQKEALAKKAKRTKDA